jgi:quercetin dioxygenase-like cupin family protein
MNATGPFLALSLLAASLPFHVAAADAPKHSVSAPDAIKWGPAPPSLPAGAQAAVLHGDPGKEGAFVLRVKFPAGFVVPPHTHTKDELVTIISGKMKADHGDKVEKKGAMAAGTFMALPAGMVHYAWAETESVVQINGIGPFDIKYVNPKDDPRNKAEPGKDAKKDDKAKK